MALAWRSAPGRSELIISHCVVWASCLSASCVTEHGMLDRSVGAMRESDSLETAVDR